MGICVLGRNSDSNYPKKVSKSLLSRNSDSNYPKKVSELPSIQPGNPDPANYKIIETLTIGKMLIIEIQYPDCKNYEGKKILVYEGVTQFELRRQKYIDPHFSTNRNYHSPIARFEPTGRGWAMAESFAKMWSMKK